MGNGKQKGRWKGGTNKQNKTKQNIKERKMTYLSSALASGTVRADGIAFNIGTDGSFVYIASMTVRFGITMI